MHSITDNYLRAIFESSYLTGKTSNKRLASLLGVSPATTTEYVKKLRQQGLVTKRKYSAISLSDAGQQAATGLMKKFHLCQVWLDQELNLTLVEVAQQAWCLASFDSNLLFRQLNEYLGFPEVTPFGSQVQGPCLYNERLSSLYDLEDETNFIFREYLSDKKVIRYVEHLGLQLDQEYFLENTDADFDVLVLATKTDKKIMVNHEIARYLYVELSN